MGATAAVAKKKGAKTGPKPSAEGPRKSMVALKCRDGWKEWLIRYAKSQRVTPSQIIDIAVAKMAAEDGFETPPER